MIPSFSSQWLEAAKTHQAILKDRMIEDTGISAMKSQLPQVTENTDDLIIKTPSRSNERQKKAYMNNEGIQALHEGRHKQAIDIFQQALSVWPDSVEATLNLSTAYIAEQKFSKAIAVINDGLFYHLQDISLIRLKARLLFESEQYEQVLKTLSRFQPNIADMPDFYGLKAATKSQRLEPPLLLFAERRILRLQG